MLNNVVLIGRMTAQPEFRITPTGTPIGTFTLAVNRHTKDKEADFINCVSFSKTAEMVSTWGNKGRLVVIQGRIQTRNYETKDGQKRKAVEVVVNSVQFLDKPKEE